MKPGDRATSRTSGGVFFAKCLSCLRCLFLSFALVAHTPCIQSKASVMASSTRVSYASSQALAANPSSWAAFLPKVTWSQRNDSTAPSTWLVTTLCVVASLLILEQYVYRSKKQHLPGPTWTIPVIGKFFDSITPSMEKYKKSWSTPLSVASVFQMCALQFDIR